jgi:hypothetical protein
MREFVDVASGGTSNKGALSAWAKLNLFGLVFGVSRLVCGLMN